MKIVKKSIANECSLNELLSGVCIDRYDFAEVSQLRIVSNTKPGITILCIEADISDGMSSFVKSPDVCDINTDILFESSAFVFIVTYLQTNEDNKPPQYITISLQELMLMDIIENDGKTLNPEDKIWNMYELVDIEKQVESEIKTDMNLFG